MNPNPEMCAECGGKCCHVHLRRSPYPCVLLTETGCSRSFEERDITCQELEAGSDWCRVYQYAFDEGISLAQAHEAIGKEAK